jgi:hypothetical protein
VESMGWLVWRSTAAFSKSDSGGRRDDAEVRRSKGMQEERQKWAAGLGDMRTGGEVEAWAQSWSKKVRVSVFLSRGVVEKHEEWAFLFPLARAAVTGGRKSCL